MRTMIPSKKISRISAFFVGVLIFTFSTNAVFAAPAKRITFFQFLSSIPRTLKDNIAYLQASANLSRSSQTAQVSSVIPPTTVGGMTGFPSSSRLPSTPCPNLHSSRRPCATTDLAGTKDPRPTESAPSFGQASTPSLSSLRQEFLNELAQTRAQLQTDIFNSKQSSPIPGVSFAQSFQANAPTILSNLNNLHAGGDLTIEKGNLNILSPNYGMTITSGTITITNGSISVPTIISNSSFTGSPTFNATTSFLGNVAVGTTTPATSQFYVAGSVPTGVLGSISYPTIGGSPLDVAIQGNYAYVSVYSGADVLNVVDISNKAAPVVVGRNSAGSYSGYVAVQGRYVYKTNTGTGLEVFDVSDPTRPTLVASISVSGAGFQKLIVQGRYAYIPSSTNSKLYTFDISNPLNPFVVSSSTLRGTTSFMAAQGRYLYMTSASSSNSSSYVEVFDATNPANPVNVGSYTTTGVSALGIRVQDKYAYTLTGDTTAGMRLEVIDISSSTTPTLVGSLAVATSTYSYELDVQGRYAYITNYGPASGQGSAFSIVDISTPASPTLVGVLPLSFKGMFGIVVQGRYAYVTSQVYPPNAGNSKILIFDLGGSYIQQLEAGGIEANRLALKDDLRVFGNADVNGGLFVNRGAQITGPFSVYGSSSSTGAFTIDQLNNVGIGTSIPSSTLHVFNNTSTIFSLANGLTGGKRFDFRTGSIASGTLDIFDFTSSTSRLTIDASGNVGIGTQFPSSTLHVVGTSTFTGTTIFSGVSSSTGITFTNATGTTLDLTNGTGFLRALTVSSTAFTFMNATGSGNLQLGTLNLSSEFRGASTTLSTLTVTSCVGCGSISTSSALTAGYFPYWTNTTGGLNGTSTLFYNTASSTIGIGMIAPTSLLHLGAGTTSIAPLGFTSGPLLATTTAGKIEFLTDDYYATITSGAGVSFTSDYPPAQSGTYVKATTEDFSASYNATDPAKSLIGTYAGNSWATAASTSQRFHIDLGSAKTVTRIYYENLHSAGSATTAGVQNFTLWGSNNAGAFADTTYATDTNWTQITTASSVFLQHSASNAVDPKYITLTNSTAYRYYAFKFADSYGGGGGIGMGVRRIELQEGGSARKALVMTDGSNLVSGRIPYASTNGRLIDNTNFVFDGASLGIGTATPSSTLTVVGTSQFSATSTFATRVLIGTSTQSAINGSTSTLTVCALSNCTKPSASTSTDTVSFFASTDGTTAGSSIIARGTITGGQADFGEYITVIGDASTYQAGDVLRIASSSSTTFEKSTTAYDPHLAGVVTETAGFIAGGGVDNHGSVVIALVGRVPVKVSLENGPIHIGDPLTTSPQTGIAMLQTEPGLSLGSALEELTTDPSTSSGQATTPKIMVFVKTGFSIGTLPESLFSHSTGSTGSPQASSGQATLTPQTADTDILSGFTNAVRFALQKLGASIKNGVAYISELFADTITAKDVKTDRLCVGATCVNESQLQQLLNQNTITPSAPDASPAAEVGTPTPDGGVGADPVVPGDSATSTPTSTDPVVETPPPSDPVVPDPAP